MQTPSLEECPICLQKLKPSARVHRLLTCNHKFHQKCISDWSFVTEKCPVCRQSFSSRQSQHFATSIPVQKRKTKHAHKLFQFFTEDFPDFTQITRYIEKHKHEIDWNAKSSEGLFLIDYGILYAETPIVAGALENGFDIYQKNGNGDDALVVLRHTILNTNHLPITIRVKNKRRMQAPLTEEEQDHYYSLQDLAGVRHVILEHLSSPEPKGSIPKVQAMEERI